MSSVNQFPQVDLLRLHHVLMSGLMPLVVVACAANTSRPSAVAECPEAAALQASALPKDALDSESKYLQGPAPIYPRRLRSSGVQGRVGLSFVVGVNGKAERCSIRVTEASDSGFIESSKETVLKSTFTAGVLRGLKVRALVNQNVNYTIGGR